MTPDEIVRTANEQGLQLVRFLYCDNGGVIRGKSTHVNALARRMASGIGLVKGMQSFTSIDTLAPDATYGPVGEIRQIPAASSKGLSFDAAFENEFYLAYRADDGFVPVDRSLCFSAIGMESTEPV